MAGTRLLLQTVFVVEFLVVISIALYAGILRNPTDRLSVAVFQQGGRSLLATLIRSSAVLNNGQGNSSAELDFSGDSLSPSLWCQESQKAFWNDIVQTVKLSSDKVTVHGDDTTTRMIPKYCENPSLLLEEKSAARPDLIVCDFWIPRDRARLVAAAGTLLLYTRSIAKRRQALTDIFPQDSGINNRLDCLDPSARINLALAVDAEQTDDNNWKEWSASLQNNLVASSFQDSWQALVRSRRSPIHFKVKVVNGASAIQSTVQENNQTMHYFDPLLLNDIFGPPSLPNHQVDVIFYLASKHTAFGESSTASTRMVTQGSRFAQILPASETVSNKDEATKKALGDATDWITRTCMGIPMEEAVDEESIDGSLPRWYVKLWWRRTLTKQYQKALQMAQRQAEVWNEMSYRSPLTSQLVQEFKTDVLDPIDEFPLLLVNQSFSEALTRLEQSLARLEGWEMDDTFMPPLDFPPEQYAAIFAPLAVPLLLPLLVGLVREYKRYRELVKKKQEKKEKAD